MAKFAISTYRGSKQLAHGGYRYNINRKSRHAVRWLCNRNNRYTRCNIHAFTKEVNGVLMARFPEDDKHNHDPVD